MNPPFGRPLSRRQLLGWSLAGSASALALLAGCGGTAAAAQSTPAASPTPAPSGTPYPAWIRVGISLPFSGVSTLHAQHIRDGALLAIAETNQAGGVGGKSRIEHWIMDEGTAAANGDDPQQASFNMLELVSDPGAVVMIGGETSNAVQSMLGSQVDQPDPLVLISPTATATAVSDPQHAVLYRPKGQPYFFRTVTTDNYQGPGMASYAAAQGVKSCFVLAERGSTYGEGIAAAFAAQAKAKGVRVTGSVALDPSLLDYQTTVAQIAAQRPDGVYYGGGRPTWEKLVGSAPGLSGIPMLMSGDGIYDPTVATESQAENWFVTISTRYVLDSDQAKTWAASYQAMFNSDPLGDEYAMTSYVAMKVAADAMSRVIAAAKPLTRTNIQAAVATTNLNTVMGNIQFDKNGDLTDHAVSVLQISKGRFRSKGLAPAT